MIRLHPDPLVALVAYRWPSLTKDGVSHDCALMLGDALSSCPASETGEAPHAERVQAGSRIVCGRCAAVIRYWSCDCPDATFRERPCRHVPLSIAAYKAERAAAETSPRLMAKLCACGHPASLLCDFEMPLTYEDMLERVKTGERCNGATKTCDAQICERCTTRVGSTFLCRRGRGCDVDSVDRCPKHAPPPTPKVVR